MSDKLKELERQARELPSEDRARLVQVLLETLRGTPLADVEAEWNKEIGERVAAYDRGELETHLAEDVFAEARRIGR